LAGHSVIIDAVFLAETERNAAESVASRAGATFTGIWLEAGQETMRARVAVRTGDASDATEDVVLKQMQTDPGRITWHRQDASGSLENTLAACRQHIR
jgi:predicted kinase